MCTAPNKILTCLSDWNTPGWLLRIIASYLSDRQMIVRYRGEQSSPRPLPSGRPQGDLLTIILFLVLVSDCRQDVAINRVLLEEEHGPVVTPTPVESTSELRLKYFDDLSPAEAVSLKSQLTSSDKIIGPKNFHQQNDLELKPENSKLQKRLDEI